MRFSTDADALRRAFDVIADALIVVAALVGATLALGQSFAGVGWVLVSLAGLTGQLVWTWSQQQGPWSPMGRAVVLRSAAAVSTAVCLTIAGGSLAHALGAALAASVLVGSIVMEPFVGRAARFKVPLAVRLPGLPTPRERRDLGWLTVIFSIGATFVGLLTAVLGVTAWLWLAVADRRGAAGADRRGRRTEQSTVRAPAADLSSRKRSLATRPTSSSTPPGRTTPRTRS